MKTINVNESSAPFKKGDIIGCIECGGTVKIEKFDEEKMEITFSCSKCAQNNRKKTKKIVLEDYIKAMDLYSHNFNICSICKKRTNEEKDLEFCTICELIICPNCINEHIISSKHNCSKDSIMNNGDKNTKCQKHCQKAKNINTHFCKTHQIHYCELCQKNPNKKERHHKTNGCNTEEFLDIDIGENERIIFKTKIETTKNKKELILDENNKKKNLLLEKLNQRKNEINKKKNDEIKTIENNQKKEEEKYKKQLEEEKKQIEEEFERKYKELELKRNNDKKLSEEKYEKLKNENNIKSKKEIENKNNKYDGIIKEVEKKYNNDIYKLDNDEKIHKLDYITEFLEMIERAYDKNKENYYNIMNYLFVTNDFKKEETPNPNNEEEKDNIKLNINVKHNNEMDIKSNINNNIKNKIDIKNNINNNIKNEEIKNNIDLDKSVDFRTSLIIDSQKTIIKDSKIYSEPFNTFEVFESINKELYIVYLNNKNSIVSCNLTKDIKEEIYKIVDESINISLRYAYDKIENRDIIVSNIPIKDKSKTLQKVWNLNYWQPLGNFEKNYYYFCSIFVEPNQITQTKSFCNQIKETDYSSIFYLDTYYDHKNNNTYIIGGGKKYIKSVNFKTGVLYKTYDDIGMENEEEENYYTSLMVYEKEKSTFLCGLKFKSIYLRIWDFHGGNIIYKIEIESPITSFCLWDNDYLFVGCEDNTIKLYSIDEGEKIDELKEHSSCIMGLKKLNINNENMLFSQDKNGNIIQYKISIDQINYKNM